MSYRRRQVVSRRYCLRKGSHNDSDVSDVSAELILISRDLVIKAFLNFSPYMDMDVKKTSETSKFSMILLISGLLSAAAFKKD